MADSSHSRFGGTVASGPLQEVYNGCFRSHSKRGWGLSPQTASCSARQAEVSSLLSCMRIWRTLGVLMEVAVSPQATSGANLNDVFLLFIFVWFP